MSFVPALYGGASSRRVALYALNTDMIVIHTRARAEGRAWGIKSIDCSIENFFFITSRRIIITSGRDNIFFSLRRSIRPDVIIIRPDVIKKKLFYMSPIELRRHPIKTTKGTFPYTDKYIKSQYS